MKCRHDEEAKPLIAELCHTEEGIMRADKQVSKLSRSYRRFMTVEMDRIKDHLDRQSSYQKGKKEERYAIARNLLAKDSTPEFVSEITGLSLEEIAKL